MSTFFSTWGLIVCSAILDSYAAFIVKTKFNELGKIDYHSLSGLLNYFSNFFKSPLLLSGVVAFVAAPGLWFLALNKVDLSLGYPILVVFHLFFVFIFGVFLLGESLDPNKIIGTVLIFISLFFFYKGK